MRSLFIFVSSLAAVPVGPSRLRDSPRPRVRHRNPRHFPTPKVVRASGLVHGDGSLPIGPCFDSAGPGAHARPGRMAERPATKGKRLMRLAGMTARVATGYTTSRV